MEEKSVSLQSVVMEIVGKFNAQGCVTGMGKYKWARLDFCLLNSSALEVKRLHQSLRELHLLSGQMHFGSQESYSQLNPGEVQHCIFSWMLLLTCLVLSA